MALREKIKYYAYRLPFVTEIMSPKYEYKINPGQLAALINLIESSRCYGGSVCEIGVAQGDTSVFLLEHLKTVCDERPLLLFDTFSGFTEDSIAVEVNSRGKSAEEYDKFQYGDEKIFARKLKRQGYSNFRTVKGDAAKFDWSSIAPIGAVLLDIDLYAPTRAILDAIWPHLEPGGGIVLDDCLADTPWDGSLQAYEEFIAARDLPFERVGEKGAVVRKV
jgi:O-methyltransferase